jgi:polysaccharide export outer membrane protein
MASTRYRVRHITLGVATAALIGCAASPEPQVGMAASSPNAELGQAGYTIARPTTYAIRPADRLSIVVFREPDLSLESVRVGVEGNISLPMIGSIPVAGMTAKQFEQDVTRRLAAAGLKNPIVSVNVAEFASHLVTVEGSVTNPGVYTFQPGARLSGAIALAGGPTRVAKSAQLVVFRETPEGIMIAKFDNAQINQGTMIDPILEPGDRVVLGTSGLAQFWQDFLKTVPLFGIFVAAAVRGI